MSKQRTLAQATRERQSRCPSYRAASERNMSDSANPERPRPETDEVLVERNRGVAERAALGNNPYGSMVRIILGVVAFIVVFGTIFYLAMN